MKKLHWTDSELDRLRVRQNVFLVCWIFYTTWQARPARLWRKRENVRNGGWYLTALSAQKGYTMPRFPLGVTMHSRLSHLSRRRRRRSKRCPLMNGMATHEWTLYMTQVTETASKTNCSRNILTPYLETPKYIATKSGQTDVLDRALPSCKFLRRSAQDICLRAKSTYFSL